MKRRTETDRTAASRGAAKAQALATVPAKARGRPLSFDREAVLDKAMHVFWEHGYEGASLTGLTKAMGISTTSMYAAFGNKEELFRKAFADGNRKRWRLNHTPLFLDFLEGKTDFGCTAWGIPSYSLLGWQKPCYLMSDGYVKTYKELIETTDWDSYGRGKDPRCANCMAHCGYEPSAVLATMGSLKESLRAMRGA